MSTDPKLNKLKESLAPPEPETPKNSTTFGEWMDFWYQNYSKPNLRPSTRQKYENAIYKHIIPALGAVPLEKLTTNDLQQFYTKLKSEGRLIRTGLYGAGISNRTVWSCHTRCRTALDRAVKDGLIHTNPAEGCSLPPQNAKEMQILTNVIGHVSASTTLNIYTHVTDAMRQSAADKIDRGIAKCEPSAKVCAAGEGVPAPGTGTRQRPAFEPYRGKIRKAGTGCVTQLNDHLWEGKFSPKWPDGKIHSRNVYAKTEQECEELLAKLIRQMRAEIAEAKLLVAEGRPFEAVMLALVKKKSRGTRDANV